MKVTVCRYCNDKYGMEMNKWEGLYVRYFTFICSITTYGQRFFRHRQAFEHSLSSSTCLSSYKPQPCFAHAGRGRSNLYSGTPQRRVAWNSLWGRTVTLEDSMHQQAQRLCSLSTPCLKIYSTSATDIKQVKEWQQPHAQRRCRSPAY